MPNYTTNLNLEKPLQSEQYNVNVFNANADKIDQFAGQTPPYALTAGKLTTGAKINGVNFKGDTDIVTGAGFYYNTVTYGVGDLAFIYNQDSALELHKSLQAGNRGHNPLTSTGYWEKQNLGGGGASRNIGEIVTSTIPLEDEGLHLLDGTRLSGDGVYKSFVDYVADLYESTFENVQLYCWQSGTSSTLIYTFFEEPAQYANNTRVYDSSGVNIIGRVTGYSNNTIFVIINGLAYSYQRYSSGDVMVTISTASYFTSESNWQTSVANNGVCGKFVYDSTLNTVRLPKISGYIEGTIDLNTLGDYIKAGLPNITGEISTISRPDSAGLKGCFGGLKSSSVAISNNGQTDYTAEFNASWSNSIYGNSSTVQTDAINVLYYIVISTGTKTDIESDIDRIATDLNNKMDKSSIFVSGTTLVIS